MAAGRHVHSGRGGANRRTKRYALAYADKHPHRNADPNTTSHLYASALTNSATYANSHRPPDGDKHSRPLCTANRNHQTDLLPYPNQDAGNPLAYAVSHSHPNAHADSQVVKRLEFLIFNGDLGG